jgi:type IV pilus assembly protein PilC
MDPRGLESQGIIEVADPTEALKRVKEMGLFPTRISPVGKAALSRTRSAARIALPTFKRRRSVKAATLTVFTRQLATLIEAGMPLLRGLRILEQQEENPTMKRVIADLGASIEAGGSFKEAVSAHPKVFSRLYINMVGAGEISGALEVTLKRLAEFLEKARKIKGKVKAASFYPCAVVTVAIAILALLMVFIIPRFKDVFAGLGGGRPLPAFTRFVFGISTFAKDHAVLAASALALLSILTWAALQTVLGRRLFDHFKLSAPMLGPLFRKTAISRFARTLGTLTSSGVPILQALNIVKETAGNVVVSRVIEAVHENVKAGEPIAATLKASGVFPVMVAGMVEVGEQTGALPDMLMKIADNYDEEVDNATSALSSLLEPIMIVFLAVLVGSIVIAMFLPLIGLIQGETDFGPAPGHGE